MNAIDPLSALNGSAPGGTSASGGSDRLGQDTFLELMTTQLRNQDPLKPLDNSDFMGQLAQFGTVNGISELQASFDALRGALTGNRTLEASQLIGRTVLAPGSEGALPTGGGLEGAVDVPDGARSVTVTVTDPSGDPVRRIDLGQPGPGLAEFAWNGISGGGARMPADTYGLRADVVTEAGTQRAAVLVADRVESVTPDPAGGPVMLGLEEAGPVAFTDIRRVGADG
jgi:flagellar basal-body rod modification protein FlgD